MVLTLLTGIQLGRSLSHDDAPNYTIALSYGGGAPNSTIQSGSTASQASYTIFRDGVTYFARNGTTGTIDYQSANASWVVNAAIASFPIQGGSLYFTTGTYYFSNSIVIRKPDITIEGTNDQTTIFWLNAYANCSLILISSTTLINFIYIENLELWGNRGSEGGKQSCGINITAYAGDIFIQNVFIDDFLNSSIFVSPVTSHIWNLWIQDCHLEGNGQHGIMLNANSNGIHYVYIADNCIFANSGNGIEILNDNGRDIDIEGCTIWGNYGHGILLYGAEYTNIVGNQIFDNSYGSKSTHDGICIGEYSGKNSKFITIVGNTINDEGFTNTQRYGINIENSTSSLTIVGNDLKGNNVAGMHISSGAAKNSCIASNLGTS
jgi:parallel beta-helix repeat protein